MFLGSYRTFFSGRNRIILPKKLRRELGQEDKFYLVLGENGEIWGFDQNNFLKLSQTILDIPLSSDEGRIRRINFFPRADECELDDQGRFILPTEFVGKAKLRDEVLILGAGDHFEIWDPGVYDKTL